MTLLNELYVVESDEVTKVIGFKESDVWLLGSTSAVDKGEATMDPGGGEGGSRLRESLKLERVGISMGASIGGAGEMVASAKTGDSWSTP
jgi:hypothetical protein